VIASFGDRATQDFYNGVRTRRSFRLPSDLRAVALRKLDTLNAAHDLRDLRSPPGNRLEALRGDWSGFHSVRINQQWRLVFRWHDAQAHDVQIVDYHRG
jgi:proteic killer suppression protein